MEDNWHSTGISAETITEASAVYWQNERYKLLITRLDDVLIGFAAICPHAGARFSADDVYRGRVSCQMHGWKFDIATGQPIYPRDENRCLKKYPVAERDGVIWVELTRTLPRVS